MGRSAGRSRSRASSTKGLGVRNYSAQFIALVGFLVLVFLMGGASRPDVVSMVVIRPIAVLALFFGLYRITKNEVRAHRFLFAFATAMAGIVLVHLIPLPPFVWQSLPGRELIVEVDRAAGLGDVWRPLAMAPNFAVNALFALCVPLAVLSLGVQLNKRELYQLSWLLIGLAAASTMLGSLQMLGDKGSSLYLFRYTHRGIPVGLFANRNHQALFLACAIAMLPLVALAWRASLLERSRNTVGPHLLLTALGAYLFAFILVTGSRAGTRLGLLAVAACPILYCAGAGTARVRDRISPKSAAVVAAVLVAVITIVGWLLASGQALALRRFRAFDLQTEDRDEIWRAVWGRLGDYMPFGAGAGSYEKVYQTFEARNDLGPTYSNHAHNDWLEVVFTFGWIGIAFLIVAVVAWVIAMRSVLRLRAGEERAIRLLGLMLILMAAAASITDYPLRVPSLSALFVIACLWTVFRPKSDEAV